MHTITLQQQVKESKARVASLQTALAKIGTASKGADVDMEDAGDAQDAEDAELDAFEAQAPGGDELDGMNEVGGATGDVLGACKRRNQRGRLGT